MSTLDAMATNMENTIAVLKRSDADLFIFHAGTDWASESQQLGQKHCFDVRPMLIAPGAHPGSMDRVAQQLSTCAAGNGWFKCKPSEAAMALYEATLSPPVSLPSTQPTLDTWVAEGAVGGEQVTQQDALGVSDDESILSSDDDLWQYVEGCQHGEADKAADVRSSLEASLGKSQARKVLSKTKATVARNAAGHKTRVLQADKKYLRLKK